MFFSFCSISRLSPLYPSPWPFFSLLISLLHSFCFLITLSLSLSLTPLFVWVCTNGAGDSRLASDWLAKAYKDWLYTVYGGRREEGERTPAGWGQGERSESAWVFFCFEMAGFEGRRGTSRWHTELLGPDYSAASPSAKAAAFLLLLLPLCSGSAVTSCASSSLSLP